MGRPHKNKSKSTSNTKPKRNMKLTITTSIIANLLVSRVSGAGTLQLYQGSQTLGVDTWEEARDFCIAKDSTLATKDQICKNGLTSPGIKSGNHWAPVLDGSDRYIQAGSGNRNGDTCKDFKDLCKITPAPTSPPTQPPTNPPTPLPTPAPTPKPTPGPTPSPTNPPTHNPTLRPTAPPTSRPTPSPTPNPTPSPTNSPTDAPKLKGGCQRVSTVLSMERAYHFYSPRHVTLTRSTKPQ